MAVVSLSLTEYGKTAADTRAALASRIDKLNKYIASLRIAAKDVKTSGYELAPNYEMVREKRVQKGYAASAVFTVTVRNMAGLGAVIDGSAEKCSAMINDVSFGLQNREEIERSLRPNTRVFYLESPSSNIFRVLPLREIAAQAHACGAVTVIDNTWATPLYQKPLELGIDYSIHSATKYLGGHSDVLGGVVLGSEERMDALRGGQRASWGACMDPFAAWLLIRSLRTLEVRMARHSASADKVARFLQEHPRVRSVCYPGLETDEGHTLAQTQMTGYSGLMSFVPDADNEAIHAMVKSLDVFEEGPSWGGFESVVNTPGLNPNREMLQFEGIPQGLVRISVGLEDADTLIEDLERALNTLPR